MHYFWQVNSTNTTAARSWVILDLDDTGYSIANLITNLKTYVGTGLFGLGNFGLGLICFIIILGVTGTMKLKYGLTNDGAILGVMFALVAMLDVGFGLIPNPVNAVPHFTTIFVGVLLSGIMFKEMAL
jgi:hypothetical protein